MRIEIPNEIVISALHVRGNAMFGIFIGIILIFLGFVIFNVYTWVHFFVPKNFDSFGVWSSRVLTIGGSMLVVFGFVQLLIQSFTY